MKETKYITCSGQVYLRKSLFAELHLLQIDDGQNLHKFRPKHGTFQMPTIGIIQK